MNIEKVKTDERPRYRILDAAGFFGPDDTLYTVDDQGNPAEIFYDGEPAIEMEPLNEPARVKYIAMLERLEDLAKKTAEKLGRPYTGRARTLDGGLSIATEVQRMNMSVMGDKNKEASNIEKAEREDVPLLGARRRGRPRKTV